MNTAKIQLKTLREKYPHLMQHVANTTSLYSTPIIYPSRYTIDAKPPFCSSGTFTFIGQRFGVLTNHHVAKFVVREHPNYIYVPLPWPKTGFLPLQISQIISLPTEQREGIDMAFIELSPAAPACVFQQLNKQFWYLDASFADHMQGKLCVESQSLHNYLWLTHGNSFSGRELKKDGDNVYWDHPHAAPYFLGPRSVETIAYRYPSLSQLFYVDEVLCFVDKEMSRDAMPGSFEGMSGAGVWRIEFGPDLQVQFNLAGLATAEGHGRDSEVDKIFFHGTVALYRYFYPFCLGGFSRKRNASITSGIEFKF